MEWYHWLICICPVIVGGSLGWFLDVKKDFGARRIYWLLGFVSGMPFAFVAGVVNL